MSARRMSRFLRLFGQLFFAILLVVAGAVIPARADCLAASQVDQARTVVRAALIASGSSLAAFNTDQPVTLSFSPSALPKGAEVIDAELRLRLENLRGDPNFRISVNLDLPTSINFGGIAFRPGNLRTKQPAVWKANNTALAKLAVGGDSDVRLKLEAPDLRPGVETYEWYGPGETDFSLRPRLILTYRMPGAQPREAVGLPNAISAAAFAGSTFVDFFTKPRNGLVAYPLAGQVTVVSQVPALGDGVIYILTETALEARSSISGATLWSIPVSIPVENPKVHLLADSSDHLYVVANGVVRRFRIDPRNRSAPAREDTPVSKLDSAQAPALDPSQAPTLGPDGSLYALNDGSVIGLDPNFRALWSIPLGHNKVSPITVGPTGCFAYLVSAPGKGDGLKGLLAIDTATGDKISSDLPNQADLQSFDHPALHAPVVLLHSEDGTEKVYVAADTGTNGTLDEFDNQREAAELKRGWEITGLWSQPLARPVSDADKKGDWEIVGARADRAAGTAKIEVADWMNGNTQKSASYPKINVYIDQMAASAVPAIDAAGRFYLPLRQLGLWVLSPSGPFGPMAFRDSSAAPINRPERPFANGPDERLMIGPDGALYGLFSDSRIPYGIFATVDLTTGSDVKLCGKTPLFATGPGSSVRLSAEDAVILGPGTRLEGETRISTGSCP
jgi:hypothetical protein